MDSKQTCARYRLVGFLLEPEVHERLRFVAARQDVSKSEILRRAVVAYVGQTEEAAK
jgi:predicted transcriptional regulator